MFTRTTRRSALARGNQASQPITHHLRSQSSDNDTLNDVHDSRFAATQIEMSRIAETTRAGDSEVLVSSGEDEPDVAIEEEVDDQDTTLEIMTNSSINEGNSPGEDGDSEPVSLAEISAPTQLREFPAGAEESLLDSNVPPASEGEPFPRVQTQNGDSSQADFVTRSKPPRQIKKMKIKANLNESNEESEVCTICFEQWTTAGQHRLVCLKCGHLFGKSCIEKWLGSQVKGTCPQCNLRASRKDIRHLYTRRLMQLDTSELENLKRELEAEKQARKRAEMDSAMMKLQWEQSSAELHGLAKELDRQRNVSEINTKQMVMMAGQASLGNGCYVSDRNISIEAGGCRALAYNGIKFYLCLSQASSSPLYPGFGVKKLSTIDFKTSQYIPIHSKLIRDLSLHPNLESSLLLSCGMDKMVKITSLDSLENVQSFTCPTPVWSCTWDSDRPTNFFAGTQNGLIFEYDIRNTRDFVSQLLSSSQNSQSVVSLKYVPRSSGDSPGPGGLLVGRLSGSLFLESKDAADYLTHFLSNESVLTSLSREDKTGHILASYRPTVLMPYVRHEVHDLVLQPKPPNPATPPSFTSFYERVAYEKVRTFNGGASQGILSRSILLPHPEMGTEQLLLCAGEGNSPSLNLWNVSSGLSHQKLVGPEGGAIDICPISCDQGRPYMLSALGNKNLFLFKWKDH